MFYRQTTLNTSETTHLGGKWNFHPFWHCSHLFSRRTNHYIRDLDFIVFFEVITAPNYDSYIRNELTNHMLSVFPNLEAEKCHFNPYLNVHLVVDEVHFSVKCTQKRKCFLEYLCCHTLSRNTHLWASTGGISDSL